MQKTQFRDWHEAQCSSMSLLMTSSRICRIMTLAAWWVNALRCHLLLSRNTRFCFLTSTIHQNNLHRTSENFNRTRWPSLPKKDTTAAQHGAHSASRTYALGRETQRDCHEPAPQRLRCMHPLSFLSRMQSICSIFGSGIKKESKKCSSSVSILCRFVPIGELVA